MVNSCNCLESPLKWIGIIFIQYLFNLPAKILGGENFFRTNLLETARFSSMFLHFLQPELFALHVHHRCSSLDTRWVGYGLVIPLSLSDRAGS